MDVCTQEELEWAEEQFQSRKTLTALIAGQGDCTAPVEVSWQFLKNSKSPHDPVIPQPGLHRGTWPTAVHRVAKSRT